MKKQANALEQYRNHCIAVRCFENICVVFYSLCHFDVVLEFGCALFSHKLDLQVSCKSLIKET